MPDWIDAPLAVFFGGIILTVIGLARPAKFPGGWEANLNDPAHAGRAWALVALGAALAVFSLFFLDPFKRATPAANAPASPTTAPTSVTVFVAATAAPTVQPAVTPPLATITTLAPRPTAPIAATTPAPTAQSVGAAPPTVAAGEPTPSIPRWPRVATLRNHTSVVKRAEFSPDGRFIVTASDDTTARIWSVDGTHRLFLRGHSQPINGASFSADGGRIATAGASGSLRVWDVGQRLSATQQDGILDVSRRSDVDGRGVHGVAFHPDGKHVITANQDGTVRVLRADDGTTEYLLPAPPRSGPAFSAIPNRTGDRIVVGYKNGMAWIWDVGGPSRTAVAIIEHAREQAVISAAFDPTSRYVVTAGDDMVARVWDWASSTTTPVAELHGHAGAVRSATFDHTGQKLVTGSADKQAFVWEWRRTLQPIAVLMDEAGVNSAAFSPRGDWLVTASDDATAKLWKAP